MTKSPWIVVKWVAITAALALLVWIGGKFAAAGSLWAVVGVSFIAMCVLAIYGTTRAVPMKYLFPGLFFLIALQIWPIVFTVMTSFTNYGDGHMGTKDESIKYLIAQTVKEVEGTPRYAMSVAVKAGGDVATGDITLLLTDPKDGATYAGTPNGLASLTDGVEKGPTGKITAATGYQILIALSLIHISEPTRPY